MVGVRISELAHQFDGRSVFDGLDFGFEGICLAVTGPNGSGKSTLLRILAGLLTPAEGTAELLIDGDVVPREAVRTVVGLSAPDVRLYAELSARENLRFLLRARRMDETEQRIGLAIEEVGLAERADDPVRELSSGLRQRAALAAAIVHGPRILLLDEPSSNLDEAGIRVLREVIEARSKSGLVVIATNDAEEAGIAESRLVLCDTSSGRSGSAGEKAAE